MPRAWHVAVADGRAYVAASLVSEGVFVIDVEDPRKPREVASWDTPGAAHSVFVDGGLAYVSDSGSGLLIVSTTARPPITATPTGLPITATPTPLPPRWRLFAPYLQH
ncbi:MAG: hypothetical protein IPJ58_00185 [Ardenticatenia bacterium]|nr:hypothetical protein [Ardenticatenia bacterium]